MSAATPRYPVEIVHRLAPGSPARFGGRVVGEREGAVLVHDVTGSVWVSCQPTPVPGAWVLVDGLWDGKEIAQGKCRVLNVPLGAFPRAGGDWAWAQADGGRRMRLLRGRALVMRAVRSYFDQRAFTEVDTPQVVPSPGLDLHLDATPVDAGAGVPRWLITSPEYQMKRLLAAGLPRIYQLCHCFRRGELGARHEPEFSMVEWYRTYAGIKEIMRDTEELVAHVARSVHDGSTVVPGLDAPVDVTPPWERITVAEAFDRFAGIDLSTVEHDDEAFGRIFVERVEPQLGRPRPVFLTAWPARMASLARLDPENPAVAERIEAYIGGVELCNGFGELIDAVEQRTRLVHDQETRAAAGKPVYPIDERFVAALEEGLPPCGGNALGVDRLAMIVLGATRIEDVLAVPSGRL